MKNSADQGGCYPQRPKAEVDNTLLDLQNSSYPTQPHSIIANKQRLFTCKILSVHADVSNSVLGKVPRKRSSCYSACTFAIS